MGLELPNPRRQVVKLSEILGSVTYNEKVTLRTLGWKGYLGKTVVVDLARMPHCWSLEHGVGKSLLASTR